jgi:hypothetical protein
MERRRHEGALIGAWLVRKQRAQRRDLARPLDEREHPLLLFVAGPGRIQPAQALGDDLARGCREVMAEMHVARAEEERAPSLHGQGLEQAIHLGAMAVGGAVFVGHQTLLERPFVLFGEPAAALREEATERPEDDQRRGVPDRLLRQVGPGLVNELLQLMV